MSKKSFAPALCVALCLGVLSGCGVGSPVAPIVPITPIAAAAAPTFTPAAGSYAVAQSVTLTDTTPGATLYYTTDGSTPTTASKVYAGVAIPVAATATVQVIATATGFATSGVASAVYTISPVAPPTAAVPAFSPTAGTYSVAQSVTLSDATTGATIYYTTDGTVPATASKVYSGPIAVGVGTTTVSALAGGAGFTASAVVSAVYTVTPPVAAVPTFLVAAGTYTTAQSVALADATAGATIYYTTDGTVPTTASKVYSGAIAIGVGTTTVSALAGGTGFTASAVVSAVYTVTPPVAAVPTFSVAAGTYTTAQSVALADATAGATIYYTTDGSLPTTTSKVYAAAIPVSSTTTIKAIAGGTGFTSSTVTSALYTINPVAAVPVFTPAAGTYSSAQSVTIADTTTGATIYYTTDGSTPTASSKVYTGAIAAGGGTTTVQAMATATGVAASAVASATYVVSTATPAYTYKNVQIVGGGFVDGVFFHPKQQGLMYARTDVGGAYRWNNVAGGDTQWVPLTDFAGKTDTFHIGVESVAMDPNDATRLYLAVGEYSESYGTNGAILVSTNQGQSFTTVALPFKNGSNDNGRQVAERLSVDPNNGAHLYFGSRVTGLWESTNYGLAWAQVSSFPIAPAVTNTAPVTGTTSDPGAGVIFEQFIGTATTTGTSSGTTNTVYIGVSDPTTGLYVTTNGGTTFTAVPGQPTGMYPNASALDAANGILYISYGVQTGCTGSCYSIGPAGPNAGAIWKYVLPTSGTPNGTWTNITPPRVGAGSGTYGYGGVVVDPATPSTIMVTTLNRYYPAPYDDIYRSLNGGATWVSVNTKAVRDSSLSPWVNFSAASAGSGNWLTHLAVDPFNSSHAMYGNGQTVWQTTNLLATDGASASSSTVVAGNATNWSIGALGIEETVVIGLISPSSGPANLLSVVGDLGGFTHTSLTASPSSGADSNPVLGNGTGIDYAAAAPLVIARVGYSSASRGGYSQDGGLTWTPFKTPTGVSTGNGTVAVSADGTTVVWLPTDAGVGPLYSTDGAQTWTASTGGPVQISGKSQEKVYADRVNPKKFYALAPFDASGNHSTLYVSTDYGHTFAVASTATSSYGALFVSPAAEGDLWVTASGGLYHSTNSGATFTAISNISPSYAVGFGAAAAGASYPAIYMEGQVTNDTTCSQSSANAVTIASQCVYRSTDAGATWVRINDQAHQYGYWNTLVGDPRVFGRVYFATGGRGIVQGDSPN